VIRQLAPSGRAASGANSTRCVITSYELAPAISREPQVRRSVGSTAMPHVESTGSSATMGWRGSTPVSPWAGEMLTIEILDATHCAAWSFSRSSTNLRYVPGHVESL
jgi:hypothetical protein